MGDREGPKLFDVVTGSTHPNHTLPLCLSLGENSLESYQYICAILYQLLERDSVCSRGSHELVMGVISERLFSSR